MPDFIIVILAVIFVLGIAINIHEFGHFAVAKLLGMRVEAYSFFGLGPRIWGKKIGHTDYRISAIPLGAYVKLYGDEATGALEGGESEGEVVPESELYELRPRWQKFLVMIGGPFMNILLALAIPFFGALMMGLPSMPAPVVGVIKTGGAAEQASIKLGDRIVQFDGVENPTWGRIEHDALVMPEKEVSIVVEREGQKLPLKIKPSKVVKDGNVMGTLDLEPDMGVEPVVVNAVSPDKPAAMAGLQAGDKVLTFNGQPIRNSSEVPNLIRGTNGVPIKLLVERGGERKELTVQPKQEDDGNFKVGAAFAPEQIMTREPANIAQAATFAVNSNLEIIRLTGKVFGQLFSGERSAKDAGLAGPIGIVQIISKVVHEQGFAGLVSILALISLNLGVFNLLPIPMLDGGQIALLAVEGFLGLFGIAVSMAVKEKIQLVGLGIILLLMVTTIFFDISRLFGK
ncbi:MAG: RIP metalloprotease RseP [Acidobacteria bacterium]|nr:RIP metalloprotease RseP [Acidobacteriota bacterium]